MGGFEGREDVLARSSVGVMFCALRQNGVIFLEFAGLAQLARAVDLSRLLGAGSAERLRFERALARWAV